jgi:hypothetical protein
MTGYAVKLTSDDRSSLSYITGIRDSGLIEIIGLDPSRCVLFASSDDSLQADRSKRLQEKNQHVVVRARKKPDMSSKNSEKSAQSWRDENSDKNLNLGVSSGDEVDTLLFRSVSK